MLEINHNCVERISYKIIIIRLKSKKKKDLKTLRHNFTFFHHLDLCHNFATICHDLLCDNSDFLFQNFILSHTSDFLNSENVIIMNNQNLISMTLSS